MERIPFTGNREQLVKEILSIRLTRVKDGSGAARGPNVEEGWINGLSMARLPFVDGRSELCKAIRQIQHGDQPIHQIMVNRLDAYSKLAPHRDGSSTSVEHSRWHLPIITHPRVFWTDEINGIMHMEKFVWHGPMPYMHTVHAMTNRSPINRYHLIVDLEK